VTRGDRGQATVELALCLPLLCTLLLTVVQVAVIVRDQLAVQLAAREAARAAAVATASDDAGTVAAHRATELRPLDVDIVERTGTVRATVRYVHHTDVPLVGLLLPDVTLAASVTMALEPP
jgi:Flp pilus assembly protein TadG